MYRKNILCQKKINCKEEFNLTPQDKIANMDWCKSGCECKPMGTFAKISVYCFASNLGARWEHLTIQLLWTTARLLFTYVSQWLLFLLCCKLMLPWLMGVGFDKIDSFREAKCLQGYSKTLLTCV